LVRISPSFSATGAVGRSRSQGAGTASAKTTQLDNDDLRQRHLAQVDRGKVAIVSIRALCDAV